MAQYIGNTPSSTLLQVRRQTYTFTASAGQDTFAGADGYSNVLVTPSAAQVLIYINGALLELRQYSVNVDEVVLNTPLSGGEEVVIFTELEAALINTYTISESNSAITTATNNIPLGQITNVDLETNGQQIGQTIIWDGSNFIPGDLFSQDDFNSAFASKYTTDLAEGSNLYYTDARVGEYLTSNSYATETFVSTSISTAVSNLIDTAPATLDTLNEIAAALGDDPNFATTITASIGTKLATADFTSTANTWLATKTSSDLTEGTNLYYTDARAQAAISTDATLSYSNGVVSMPLSGVTAGSYGSASTVPVITVDAQGRITSASTTNVAGVSGFSYTPSTNTYTITTSAGTSFDATGDLTSFDTGDLTEGTNLYYTDARVGTYIGTITTNALTEGSNNLYYTDVRVSDYLANNGYDSAIAAKLNTADFTSTANTWLITKNTNSLSEGSNNLYYTDTRVGDYLTNNGYDTAANIVASIVDTAPATLDTLNELAAALGDDPNFATTVTNSIGLKANTADLGTAAAENVEYFATAAQGALADSALQSVAFADLTSTPTTLAGYGITDAPAVLTDLGIVDGTIGQILTTDGAGGFTFEDAAEPLVVSGTAPSSPEEGALWFDNVTTAQLYAYVGTSWLSTAGLTTLNFSSVGDLSDVDITTSAPTAGQALVWDAVNSKFIPGESFSQSDFNTAFAANSTDDLSEGATNLYYTDARADARITLASSNYATAAQGALADTALQSVAFADLTSTPTTLAGYGITDAATSAQGALADTALQSVAFADLTSTPTTLAGYGITDSFFDGAYGSLSGTPTLGTASAQDVGYFATAAQGALADSALQSADLTGYATETFVTNAIATKDNTDEITEGSTNLYYTDARVETKIDAYVTGGTGVTVTSGSIAIGQSVATNANVTFNDITANGSIVIDGDLTVSGTTVTIDATNLAVEDNMIYLNSGSAVANPDLGIAGNYNDGTYAHAGVFRDATDGVWKFYDGYTPEPDASAFIDTTHASFNLASVEAGSFIGDLTGDVTGTVSSLSNHTTTNLTEGTNLYYTDARVGTYLTTNSYATESFVGSAITTASSNYATAAQGALADTALQSVAFADLTTTPTTLAGYGITDTIPSALTDLGITEGTTGQVLTTDGAGTYTFEDAASSVVVSGTAPSSPSEGDMWFDNVTTGQLYTYVGTSWLSTAGITTLEFSSVGDLSDVDITTVSPAAGDALVWDAVNSKFVPGDVGADFTGYATETYVANAISTASSNYATAAQGALADSALQSVAFSDLGITDGTIGQVLTTDGAGNYSFADTAVAYGDSDVATYLSTNGYDTASNIVSSIVDTAPSTLDTLNELAAALGDDANFSTTVTNALGLKANSADLGTASVQNVEYFATAAQGALADSALQSVAFADLTTTPTTLAGYGITDAFDGAYASLTGAPSIPSVLTDLGITDGTVGQVLTTDGAGGFTFADASSGGSSVTVSATAPLTPNEGDLWFDDTTTGQLYVYENGAWTSTGIPPSIGSIDELADVDTTTIAPVAGQSLVWDAVNSKFIPGDSFSQSDFNTALGTISTDIIPDTDVTYDLGSATNRFKDLYLSGNTLYLGEVTLSVTAGALVITDALSNPVSITLSNNTTDDLAEGLTNLYYTDARADARIALAASDYATAAQGALADTALQAADLTGYATESYVGTQIANLVDTAPSTLDTLNELAAALGDDPNFATTITTSLGEKVDLTGTTTAVIPFYYADQTSFPNATTYHGAIAHSHADGAMYFAHMGTWVELANSTDLVSDVGGLSDVDLITTPIADGNTLVWNASSGTFIPGDHAISTVGYSNDYSDLDNKPTLSTVAGTGDYNDLINTPVVPVSIDDLSDVDTTTAAPVDGQSLVWSSTTSKWRPSTISGGGGSSLIPTQDTAPVGPSDGQLWYDTESGTLFVYYDDGSTAQWVQVANPSSGGTVSIYLNDLHNVDTETNPPADGQALIWDDLNSIWVPGDTASSVATLTDVDITTTPIEDGQTLVWDAVNSKFVPGEGGGGGSSITVAETAPSFPLDGDMWFNSSTLSLFLAYDDGDSIQWIQVNDAGGAAGNGLVIISSVAPENPATGDLWYDDASTGTLLIYDGSVWVSTADGGGAGNQAGYWSEVATTTFDAISGSKLFIDTSLNTVQVTLPANPSMGEEVYIVDATGTAGTNNITVSRNGSKITGLDEDLTIDVDNAAILLAYYNAARGWIVLSK